MAVDVIIGLQRGDEGKGRFVDMMAPEYDVVARFNGGPNAGHTVVMPDGKSLALHGIPSGVAYPDIMNVIGNGTVIDAIKLNAEIESLRSKDVEISPDNLMISSAAHLILPHHILEDVEREMGPGKQGSTKSGISGAYADKYKREGMRAETLNNDLDGLHRHIQERILSLDGMLEALFAYAGIEWESVEQVADQYVEQAERLKDYVTDTALYLNRRLEADPQARILAEGAQAYWLDPDHGMYPDVTSSPTTTGGVAVGLGVAPGYIKRVTGVAKAIQSHVGGGHFVTEVHDAAELGVLHGDMNAGDAEKGTTTGRVRRLGYFDLAQLRRATMINAHKEDGRRQINLVITKFDWLSRFGEVIPVCVDYERKSKNIQVAPDAGYKLEQSTPQYEFLPGWNDDIQDVRRFEDLPPNAQSFVGFIEEKTEAPVTMIGVGPRRDQVIVRDAA